MNELHVNDEKIYDLILKKTIELEVENKALQENNKKIFRYLGIFEKWLKQVQHKIECLIKTSKKLELENKNLLANLKSTKQTKMYLKRLSGNTSEKLDDNIHHVHSTNCYSIKGILIKLFFNAKTLETVFL